MKRTALTSDFNISPIVLGHWRLADWGMTTQQLVEYTHQCIDIGVTTFDHADIYGDYSCESIFGKAMAADPSIRQRIELITKCGIKLVSSKHPKRSIKYYDSSYNHIVSSVNNSLRNFGADYLDLFLLHRPTPFSNPEEVARAFSHLEKEGKVRNFGVSNYSTIEFETLAAFADQKLVTNQIEISPYCLDHFVSGHISFLQKMKVIPMAWSPMAGGQLWEAITEKSQRLVVALKSVADEVGVEDISKIVYAWLTNHPSGIIPIAGTCKIERLQSAVDAIDIKLSLEHWFSIYSASVGEEVA